MKELAGAVAAVGAEDRRAEDVGVEEVSSQR